MFRKIRASLFPKKDLVHTPTPTVDDFKIPLVPDRYHLKDVGKTKQGNGFWVTTQLSVKDGTRTDYVAAYIFDTKGNLISSEVSVLSAHDAYSRKKVGEAIDKVKAKIDAVTIEPIRVRPFSVSYFGETFGLVMREEHEGYTINTVDDILVDALPGYTLMFYPPWQTCNYDT